MDDSVIMFVGTEANVPAHVLRWTTSVVTPDQYCLTIDGRHPQTIWSCAYDCDRPTVAVMAAFLGIPLDRSAIGKHVNVRARIVG